ncbi:putative O-glycosylation ligase, exosortase A system-associated [Cognaticolwellia mytili]|uniref:putative O-glycosylation ligase, exosortase A system-associated n=1 Tax=Cognaticolwellia mytili TaxID=1888913 RepID=UPI000A16DDB2|nr:putative O-glycosylation ligase, exosortase A system-associated [Cognaticolwellia mytili]
MKDIIFLLMFSPLFILALRNPFLGLCGWIWTIMAIPKNMLWGFSSDIRFTYILAIATIIGLFFDKDPLRKSPFNGMFILMLLLLIQSAFSNMFTFGSSEASWIVWSDFFKAVLLSCLIMILLTTKNRIETFLFSMLLGVGFNIFFEGLKFLATAGNYKIVGINNSMMTDNNLFALAILMVIPLYLYIISQVKHKYLKLGFAGLAGLSAVCVIGSFSRGGFIGLIIVSWQVFLKVKRKFLFILFSIVFASSAIYIAADKWTDRIQTIEHADQDASFLGRVTAWKLATIAALDSPILGAGQDSIQHFHVWSYYYSDIHDFDFITKKNSPINYPKAAHSIYFQVLGDLGFLGLILFLSMLLKGYFTSRSLLKKGKEQWIQDLSKAINTVILVYMISGGLLSMAYYDLLYVLLSVLFCIKHINSNKQLPNKVIG